MTGNQEGENYVRMELVKPKGRGLGIAAMVLGIVAVINAPIPIINVLAMPIAIVGLVFGIIAVVLAEKSGDSIGFGVAGFACSAIALSVTIYMYTAAAAAVEEATDGLEQSAETLSDVADEPENLTDGEGEPADSDASSDSQKEQDSAVDLSSVAKEHTLTAGHYTVGIDIPAGTCNMTANSGTGNVSYASVFDTDGMNEIFGVSDMDMYTSEYNNLKLTEDKVLTLMGGLSVMLTYSEVTSNFSGRTYDDSAAMDFGAGKYTAGTDFPAGTYKVVANSGTGNVSSSNLFDNNGMNEIFGISDMDMYSSQFTNVDLPEGETLNVSGGVSIKLIPAMPTTA